MWMDKAWSVYWEGSNGLPKATVAMDRPRCPTGKLNYIISASSSQGRNLHGVTTTRIYRGEENDVIVTTKSLREPCTSSAPLNKDSLEGNICVIFDIEVNVTVIKVRKLKVRHRPYFFVSYRGQELIKWVGSVGATENKMSLAATLESTLHDPIKVQGSRIA